jgi:hypothetical protein
MLMWRRNTKEPGMYGSSTMHLPERAGGGSCPVGDFFSPVLMIHAVVTHSLVGHHLSRSVSFLYSTFSKHDLTGSESLTVLAEKY